MPPKAKRTFRGTAKASSKTIEAAAPAEPEIVPQQPKVNPINAIVHNAQSNEAFHKKYIKELQQCYNQVSDT